MATAFIKINKTTFKQKTPSKINELIFKPLILLPMKKITFSKITFILLNKTEPKLRLNQKWLM